METRKLSVIMFTDMVGYSKKVQENETFALELLNEHNTVLQQQIDAHLGRTIKTIGDAFLVDFDSVINALNCAVAIQRCLQKRNASEPAERQLEVRIGIHLGDVIYKDNDVFGDGVNIASRIESIAGAGQTLVSQDVYSIADGKTGFRMTSLGEKQLKNIARPVRVYSVDDHPTPARKKSTGPNKKSRSRRVVLVASIMLAGLLLFRIIMPGEHTAMGSKPSLAIVAFSNQTGEKRLDNIEIGRIINDAIIQKFYEYPPVQLISPLRIERIIRESKIDRGDLVDNPELAERIARETGARLMISGSLKKLGSTFLLAADLHDLDDETLLASSQVHEESEAAILGTMIDSLCHRFQQKIAQRFGMRDTLQRARIGIGELTTQSLDAYRHFVLGQEHHHLGEFDDAIGEFRQALTIDSNFAIAYSMMGCSFSWAKRDSELTPAFIEKLKSVNGRFQGLSKEALIFRGNLAWFENRVEDILQNYRLTIELYPDDRDAYYYYGIGLAQLKGEHEKAIRMFEKARSFAPEYFPVYRDLAYALHAVKKTDQAVELLREYIKNFPGKREIEYARQQIAELRGVPL